jgi:Dockerin type I domain
MKKFVMILALGLFLVFNSILVATPVEKPEATPIQDQQTLIIPDSYAACTMQKHNGSVQSYSRDFAAGMGVYTYYNPDDVCASPAYPFEILDFTFSLYDPGDGNYVWPATIEIVVYDVLTTGDSCSGPGTEICRYPVSATASIYQYPTFGTYTLPTGCCVNGPFFMGIEYPIGDTATNPSVLFDNNTVVDTCENWGRNTDGTMEEWFIFWTQPGPAYPMFSVGAETESANCVQDTCTWGPGDAHKMHYPQLPDAAGWDVNATGNSGAMPLVLADDWMCSETGWVKDVHFWGSWMHGIEGEVIQFVLSIHSDIPADPPTIPYSRPGPTLWEREIWNFGAIPIDPPSMEGWYDPVQQLIIPDDHQAFFQYDVCLDSIDWFWQDEGTIYWLNISAIIADPSETQWGWKSSIDHWNDDAVWALWGELFWIDLFEPPDFLVSLDLSFVITGGEEQIGACCYTDPPSPDMYCIETTQADCENNLLGVYQGDGTTCAGSIEACCLQDGTCVMADVLCCLNELGGTPQGAGAACSAATEACCFADGSCADLDPLCCLDQGGNPQGPGSVCTAPAACCLSDGTCIMVDPLCCVDMGGSPQAGGGTCTSPEACCLPTGGCINVDPLCCLDLGGTPQGLGTSCSGQTIACCLPNGTCLDVDPLCCDDIGGTASSSSTSCLGDGNGNNIDDACEETMGACCHTDGTCTLETAADCAALPGDYKGDGTSCLGDSDSDGKDDICVTPWQNHKMHYPQLPDPTGWDVMSSMPLIVADDWMCTDTGFVKDIHFWGSWLNDNIGTIAGFTLSIWSDIPADPPQLPYSRPGTLLWEFEANDFDITSYDPPALEGWYNPSQEFILWDNHQAYFRYDVYLPEQFWFPQEEGTIYWLGINAFGVGPTGGEQWGWKSSQDRWNDDAVWSFNGMQDWVEMYEPGVSQTNTFSAIMGPGNDLISGSGSGAYGEGFYYYESGWWNIWFYDDPYVHGKKEIHIEFDVFSMYPHAILILAVNWSTDVWSLEGNPPGDRRPPLPGDLPEDLYIRRDTLFAMQFPEGHYAFDYVIPDYNPEWVSIDIMGEDFELSNGLITHTCRPSLNQAFVITNGPPCDGTCGDANGDGVVNVSDAVWIINYVFVGGGAPVPRLACGDANGDGVVNVSDAVWIINYVFVGGGPPGDCSPGSADWIDGDCCPFVPPRVTE